MLREILAASLSDESSRCEAPFSKMADDSVGWVACVGGRPVAFNLADRRNGVMRIIAVQPEHQRRGIGRELMRQAEAWLFSHGWGEIQLTIPDDSYNHSSGFFHKLGWSDWKTEGDRRVLKKATSRSIIKLEEHTITDTTTGYTRLLRLQRGPSDEPHRLCLFLDGELYWRDMDAIPLLNALMENRSLPPMTLALVGHVSAAARHEDYICNERYSRFIGTTVMDWLKKEIPSLQNQDHVLVGLSLSGLMAVYQTLQQPQHFGCCLSQSGSHWWKPEWFADMTRTKAPLAARFWLSVGDQETAVNVKHPPSGLVQEISQIVGVEKTARLLKEMGGTVHYHQFNGGHSFDRWRNELSEALPWLTRQAQGK